MPECDSALTLPASIRGHQAQESDLQSKALPLACAAKAHHFIHFSNFAAALRSDTPCLHWQHHKSACRDTSHVQATKLGTRSTRQSCDIPVQREPRSWRACRCPKRRSTLLDSQAWHDVASLAEDTRDHKLSPPRPLTATHKRAAAPHQAGTACAVARPKQLAAAHGRRITCAPKP